MGESAEELLTTLERRGFRLRQLQGGALEVVPASNPTPDDRVTIGLAKSALVRVPAERKSPTPGHTPAEATAIHQALVAFPGSRLIEKRYLQSVGPDSEQPTHPSKAFHRKDDPQQISLFVGEPSFETPPREHAAPAKTQSLMTQ